MKVALVASPCAPHQINCCNALEEGFAWHGIPTVRVAHSSLAQTDIVACWGWRNAKQHHDAGRRVLVMERGYIGDRTAWTSLGWNGLNGRATFPEVDDDGERFMRHFPEALQPEKPDGDYVLLIGQVPGDASIEGHNMERWYA